MDNPKNRKNEILIWGIKITPLSINEIIEIVENNILGERISMQVTGVNSEIIINSQSDASLREAINNSHIVNIDGMAVVAGLRLLGYHIKERAACPDIFDILLDRANTKEYKIFFLGASEIVIKEMVRKLQKEYSNLKIVGFHHGYFEQNNEYDVVNMIKSSNADILFLGISSPKKERFISNYLNFMNIPLCFGVGGVFDIKAGLYKRAPLWIQNIGMEWLFRLVQEPNRLIKRNLTIIIPFIYLVFKTLLKINNKKV